MTRLVWCIFGAVLSLLVYDWARLRSERADWKSVASNAVRFSDNRMKDVDACIAALDKCVRYMEPEIVRVRLGLPLDGANTNGVDGEGSSIKGMDLPAREACRKDTKKCGRGGPYLPSLDVQQHQGAGKPEHRTVRLPL